MCAALDLTNEDIAWKKPSGYSRIRSIPRFLSTPAKYENCNMSKNHDFSGPYKDFNPPGDRTPAVGEKHWGDPPYLPSYLDPMYISKERTSGTPDNLYFRGPFYNGTTETHAEFVNHGVLPRRQYHKYVRNYEAPGMKDERSVTQTDFQPPLPMLPREKAPCLREEPEKPWYKSQAKEAKNPHAKEVELSTIQPEVVYVDEAFQRDFSTEHNDNFICYQMDRSESKIKDPLPKVEEVFLKNIQGAHQNYTHPPTADSTCNCCRNVRYHCPGQTPKETSWLLHPKNNFYQNGVMFMPCNCKKKTNQRCCSS